MIEWLGVCFALALIVLSSICAGDMLLRSCSRRRWEWGADRLGLDFLAGCGVISLCVFGLSLAGFASRGPFLLLAAASVWLRLWISKAEIIRCLRGLRSPTRFRVSRGTLALALPIAVFLLLFVVYASGPENSPDATDYHLAFIKAYEKAGRFTPITDSYQSGFPQSIEMLFLFTDVFADFRACALTHVLFLVSAILLLIALGRLIAGTQVGLVAAGFFAISPIVGIDASTAYNDVALAGYGLAVTYLLILWERDRSDMGLLGMAGLTAGMAMSVKYTGGITIIGGGLLIAALTVRRGGDLKALIWFGIAAAVPIAPWLVKNAIYYGNPLFPFANAVFPNPYVHQAWEQEFLAQMRFFNQVHWFEVPLEVTVKGLRLTGFVGPLFLLSPIIFIARRAPAFGHILFWTAAWMLTYTANLGARFLIPALPFICLGMALAIATAPWLQIAALYLHAVISLPYVSNFYCDEHAYRIEAPALLRPWQSGSGVDYLQGEDGFIGAKLLERLTPRDAVIYTTYGIAKSYCDRHVLGAGQSSLARVLQDVLLRASGDVTTLVSLNCEFSNGVDDIQVVAETDVPMPLSVSEIALFGSASGQRFPVTVRPSINPWYGPFLSDRMLVTHWASWANVRRVSFSAHRAGTVRVVLSFAGEDMSGKWSVLGNREGVAQSSATCVSKSEPFSANLGPEAILAVRKMGVTHILLKKDDWFSHFFEPVVRLNSRLLADENSWVLFSLPALTGENSVRPPAALGL